MVDRWRRSSRSKSPSTAQNLSGPDAVHVAARTTRQTLALYGPIIDCCHDDLRHGRRDQALFA
jgi:hypothetical protein